MTELKVYRFNYQLLKRGYRIPNPSLLIVAHSQKQAIKFFYDFTDRYKKIVIIEDIEEVNYTKNGLSYEDIQRKFEIQNKIIYPHKKVSHEGRREHDIEG